jgi:hypothetical protein
MLDLKLGRFLHKIEVSKLSKNLDGTYDYDGDLNFTSMKFKSFFEIPIRFRNVNGSFDCAYNQLESLEGAPEKIHGKFNCNFNQLVNLEGAPNIIQGSFYCNDNRLVNLKGAPKEVHGNFSCYNNNLLSDKHLSKVNGNFDSDPNPFKKTENVIESISKMSYETQIRQLNFLGKVDIKAYDIFLEILEELGVNVSLRKELSSISKASGLDDIGF